uniref:Misato mitochondrial distribution and morphology regulator 1 n=1 Tax=Salmo trutta TaxID=8032 RepID=A0A674D9K7_SALTR
MVHKESPPTNNSFLPDLDKNDPLSVCHSHTSFSPNRVSCVGAVAMETVNSRLERAQKGYRLESNVRVWSDFLRIHLHPHTISVIHEYNHDGEAHNLEAFGQGEALLQGSVLEDLEDRLHFFIEGFQVLCDLADGFSGLGSKVTEMLQDSYGGRGILSWRRAPVSHPDTVSDKREVVCRALPPVDMVHVANNSSFFCPLTLKGGVCVCVCVSFCLLHPSLWYHSGSVLALALDSLTVPYRLRYNSAPMWEFADAREKGERWVVAAYGALPFPMAQGGSLPDTLGDCANTLLWLPLSACPEQGGGHCFGQSVTLKGLELHSLVSLFYFHASLCLYPTVSLIIGRSFPLTLSYSLPQRGRSPTVSSLPVLTSLQSSPALGSWLLELQHGTSALDPRRIDPHLLVRCYRDDRGGMMRASSEEDDDG